jgi:PPOX class probable F420-dependent enzyme
MPQRLRRLIKLRAMAKPPLPEYLQMLLRAPNPCVVATAAPDGMLHTAATWYEWRNNGTVLLNMDGTRRRLEHMRNDPRVALTILDNATWYRHISLVGRVSTIVRDTGLDDIDRLSQHYAGEPFRDRKRDSWSAVIDVLSWHAWPHGGRPTLD